MHFCTLLKYFLFQRDAFGKRYTDGVQKYTKKLKFHQSEKNWIKFFFRKNIEKILQTIWLQSFADFFFENSFFSMNPPKISKSVITVIQTPQISTIHDWFGVGTHISGSCCLETSGTGFSRSVVQVLSKSRECLQMNFYFASRVRVGAYCSIANGAPAHNSITVLNC